MTNRFLTSVAAIALIASAGFANAQGTGMGRDSGGAAAQQSAPSGGSSGADRQATEPSGSSSGMKGAQSEPKSSGTKGAQSEQKSSTIGQSQRGEENAPGQKSKGMSSENEGAKGAKGKSSENETKGAKDMKAEGRDKDQNAAQNREGRDRDQNAQTRERNGNMNAETRTPGTTTTGQAGAGAKLSSEQRTKITSVIRNQHVESLNNVDFNIAIGTRVPRERVHLYPLPEEVVTIYPEWRGYEFIRVRDQILVVDPRTLEIVDVIES